MKLSSILAQPLICSSISSEVILKERKLMGSGWNMSITLLTRRYFLIYIMAGTRLIILEKVWIVHTRDKVYIATYLPRLDGL